jgi:hypothetical protein
VIVFVVVAVVPGADRVKAFFMSLLAAAALFSKVMSYNADLHQKASKLSGPRWIPGAITGAPLVGSLVLIAIVFSTTAASAQTGVSDFLLSAFGLYVILFFVTRFIVGRIAK